MQMHGSEAEVWQQYGAHIAVVFSFIKLYKTLFLNADTYNTVHPTVNNITRIDIREFMI